MPKINRSRGSKAKYTDEQDRKADHIAKGYEAAGVSHKEAERRAWATVNKGKRRRQEERLGPRQEGKPRFGAQGRADRRTGRRVTAQGSALGIGAQGGSDAKAPRRVTSLKAHHAAIAWFDISLMAAIWLRRPILRAHSGQ